MDSIVKTWTVRATGLASNAAAYNAAAYNAAAYNVAAYVAGERARTAPDMATPGTPVPFAGSVALHLTEVAFAGARSTDLLGHVPRGAPV